MPLPLAPVAGFAIRYGTVALVAYGVRKALRKGRTDQRAEDALDDMDEGVAVHRPGDRGQTNAAARFRRVIRWDDTAIEIDAAALGRFRVRKV
ncbi:hypothetical protein QKW60_20415 [Defluviimonas aestuarii]|uniref:hypothetical protein n=1 Tax=Albidovulum aestuarii TaxID=1130726 RepID=UPI00249C7BB8|nr:hypothetical protein [Defluviimonas aestuarii]MDI3338782.1 hypothetical protein [Defluviimonas aestuarii]